MLDSTYSRYTFIAQIWRWVRVSGLLRLFGILYGGIGAALDGAVSLFAPWSIASVCAFVVCSWIWQQRNSLDSIINVIKDLLKILTSMFAKMSLSFLWEASRIPEVWKQYYFAFKMLFSQSCHGQEHRTCQSKRTLNARNASIFTASMYPSAIYNAHWV